VIRQAISCDICGTEKQLTNHWFVAYDQGGELRVGCWNSHNRKRPGALHLCGQTCLHKLVDDFMARALAARAPSITSPSAVAAENQSAVPRLARVDAGRNVAVPLPTVHNAASDYSDEFDSSARLLTPTEPASFSPRISRAEAWKRERERQQQAARRTGEPTRHRNIA
jgi:hypothetical protein